MEREAQQEVIHLFLQQKSQVGGLHHKQLQLQLEKKIKMD